MPRRGSTAKAAAPIRSTRSRPVLKSVESGEDAYVTALDQLPEKFLACRDMHHPWQVVSNYHLIDTTEQTDRYPRLGNSQYIERRLKCTRCGMIRSDAYLLMSSGTRYALSRLNSVYIPPKGYPLKGVPIGMSGRGELLRGLLYERMMEQIT